MTFLTGCIFFGCAFRLAISNVDFWARWGPTTTAYTLVDRHLASSGTAGQILRSTPLYSASLSFTRERLDILYPPLITTYLGRYASSPYI